MSSYKDLIVYQRAIELCVMVYKYTDNFPREETYGIVSQIRRSAVSIPSNIAEGQKRGSKNEYIQFLRVSYGSGAELETQLLISLKIGYLKHEVFEELNIAIQEIMKMLNGLIKSLKPKTDKL